MKTRYRIMPLLLLVSGWGSFPSPASQSALKIDRMQSAAIDGANGADNRAPNSELERNVLGSAWTQTQQGDKDAKRGDKETQHIITLEDNGHTLTIDVRERVLISLGGDWDWTLDAYDTTILRAAHGRTPPKGSQALLEAIKTGDTTLSLTGDPPCLKSRPPCAAQSRSFRMTIKVR